MLYVYNVTRQAFISLGVKTAGTPWARLKGFLGKWRLRSDEALWVVPSRGIHTIGLTFPVDVIYLDSALRVVHTVESLGPFRIAPIRWNCDSVLELPALSIHGSGTQPGDQLMICSPAAMEEFLQSEGDAATKSESQRAG